MCLHRASRTSMLADRTGPVLHVRRHTLGRCTVDWLLKTQSREAHLLMVKTRLLMYMLLGCVLGTLPALQLRRQQLCQLILTQLLLGLQHGWILSWEEGPVG